MEGMVWEKGLLPERSEWFRSKAVIRSREHSLGHVLGLPPAALHAHTPAPRRQRAARYAHPLYRQLSRHMRVSDLPRVGLGGPIEHESFDLEKGGKGDLDQVRRHPVLRQTCGEVVCAIGVVGCMCRYLILRDVNGQHCSCSLVTWWQIAQRVSLARSRSQCYRAHG